MPYVCYVCIYVLQYINVHNIIFKSSGVKLVAGTQMMNLFVMRISMHEAINVSIYENFCFVLLCFVCVCGGGCVFVFFYVFVFLFYTFVLFCF